MRIEEVRINAQEGGELAIKNFLDSLRDTGIEQEIPVSVAQTEMKKAKDF